MLKDKRINNENKADDFLKNKNLIILDNIFYRWMIFYKNRKCERHKYLEAEYHYQTKIKKKVLYIWKKETYRKRVKRVVNVIVRKNMVTRLFKRWFE